MRKGHLLETPLHPALGSRLSISIGLAPGSVRPSLASAPPHRYTSIVHCGTVHVSMHSASKAKWCRFGQTIINMKHLTASFGYLLVGAFAVVAISGASNSRKSGGTSSGSTLSFSVEEAPTSDIEEYLPNGSDDESDDLIQENPAYVGPIDGDSDDSSDDDAAEQYDSDDDDNNDENDDKADGKIKMNKELSESYKRGRAAGRFIKKRKAQLVVLLILFAFRREVFLVLSSLVTDPAPGGGRKMKPLSMTNLLKILLVLDVLRKTLGGGGGSGGSGKRSALAVAALFGGAPSAALVKTLFKDVFKSNPSYLPPVEQHYTFERLNERYTKDNLAMIKAWDGGKDTGGNRSLASQLLESVWMSRLDGKNSNNAASYNSTVVIIDMSNLDTTVSSLSLVRDQISFLLSHHRATRKVGQKLREAAAATNNNNPTVTAMAERVHADWSDEMEVVVMLGSPGGSAAHYGLAAQQVGRLRDEEGITLTMVVDTVAASGGYMIACMSSPKKLYASPFAVVGSIGVIGQQLNIHELLKGYGITPLTFRGGKDKAPLSLMGEVTKEGKQKIQEMIDHTHVAFKSHVAKARPVLANTIDSVATGDVWLASDAIKVGLVDRLISSDEYIGERIAEGARVLKLIKYDKRIHLPAFLSSSSSPLGHIQASMKNLREFTRDARRIVSKAASVVDDLETTDISQVAAARAFGVEATSNTVKTG